MRRAVYTDRQTLEPAPQVQIRTLPLANEDRWAGGYPPHQAWVGSSENRRSPTPVLLLKVSYEMTFTKC